jgi:hypothetical protein
LKFLSEVWAGRACAGANEIELTTCGKNWGQEGGKWGGSYKNKEARAAVGDQRSPAQFFQFLQNKKIRFFWTYEELLGILGEWVYSTPIF